VVAETFREGRVKHADSVILNANYSKNLNLNTVILK